MEGKEQTNGNGWVWKIFALTTVICLGIIVWVMSNKTNGDALNANIIPTIKPTQSTKTDQPTAEPTQPTETVNFIITKELTVYEFMAALASRMLGAPGGTDVDFDEILKENPYDEDSYMYHIGEDAIIFIPYKENRIMDGGCGISIYIINDNQISQSIQSITRDILHESYVSIVEDRGVIDVYFYKYVTYRFN